MKVDVNLFLSRLSYVMDRVMEYVAVPFISVSYANTFYSTAEGSPLVILIYLMHVESPAASAENCMSFK